MYAIYQGFAAANGVKKHDWLKGLHGFMRYHKAQQDSLGKGLGRPEGGDEPMTKESFASFKGWVKAYAGANKK